MIIPHKDRFRKVIIPPPDKALTQRAIILSLLTKKMRIFNPSLCGDCISALDCITALNARIKITNEFIEIDYPFAKTARNALVKLYAGNSATAARLLLGATAGLALNVEISGDSSLKRRPMKATIKPLKKMGAKLVPYRQKCPILSTPATLKGIKYHLDSPSAQTKSAILLAALNAKGETRVYEQIKTRDHTERMLAYFGYKINQTSEFISILPSSCTHDDPEIKVAGDISSASFLIAAALLTKNGYAYINEVGINPTRMGFVSLLINSGANIEIEPLGDVCNEPIGNIIVNHSELNCFEIDANTDRSLIDEIPILAVIACFCKGKSVFKNLSAIKNKESNRMREIFKYLKKFGANVELIEDTLTIEGNNLIKTALDLDEAKKKSRGRRKKPRKLMVKAKDHRIIMAMTIAAMLSDGCVIAYPHLASISYPNFFSALLD